MLHSAWEPRSRVVPQGRPNRVANGEAVHTHRDVLTAQLFEEASRARAQHTLVGKATHHGGAMTRTTASVRAGIGVQRPIGHSATVFANKQSPVRMFGRSGRQRNCRRPIDHDCNNVTANRAHWGLRKRRDPSQRRGVSRASRRACHQQERPCGTSAAVGRALLGLLCRTHG
mgnify:CR=1 FL=1